MTISREKALQAEETVNAKILIWKYIGGNLLEQQQGGQYSYGKVRKGEGVEDNVRSSTVLYTTARTWIFSLSKMGAFAGTCTEGWHDLTL